MFVVLFLLSYSLSKYVIGRDTEDNYAYRTGRCYYSGDDFYNKVEIEGSTIKAYESQDCKTWSEVPTIDIGKDLTIQSGIPLYSAMAFDYSDKKECALKLTEAFPMEKYFKEGCVKLTDTSSVKRQATSDSVLVLTYDKVPDCKGEPSKTVTKPVDKCILEDTTYFIYSSGTNMAFVVMVAALLALLI
ncbi:hypothetical protein EIN_257940 [Entamoeba invadens IP1]|uniref:Uncharacterized protein n=1 Tax=Entamoeba invadens IP1 TaxID=370355 RepID=A0A0A1TXE6_ENTIV|nr:hypothetical protein EIN_257940 [Entamoeba invadens IP1]ELP84180.1 hypothetical protein EIN_257940 [Entamoeba invadens IP1]|eukprot:XP_004183526.1 hypothetical protein EIN_257940 [Entamoeba invadens IP1]